MFHGLTLPLRISLHSVASLATLARRVRVAIVIEHFVARRGGAEASAVRVVEELQRRGVDVTVVCRQAEPPTGPEIGIIRLRVPGFWQPMRVSRFSREAGRATAHGFDIVHSFSRTRHQTVYRAGGGSHAAYIERVYRYPRLQRSLSPRHHAILRIEEAVLRDPTQLIQCVSQRVAAEIASRYQVSPERLVNLYNGVDAERFNPAQREPRRAALRTELELEGPVALFVGSGFHRKGLDRALRGLAESGGSTCLLVAGRGDPRPYRQLAGELGVEGRVRFLGHRNDVEALHAAADLLVLPTRYDPFANAVLEGMASGLPVATTPVNGVAELIEHGKNGFIYKENFGPAFRLLQDHAGLAPVSAAARRTAEHFTWSDHADQLLQLYSKLQR